MMIYSLTKNHISIGKEPPQFRKCLYHYFSRDEAYFQEDEHNAFDNDPATYYETISYAITNNDYTCTYCGRDLQSLIWE